MSAEDALDTLGGNASDSYVVGNWKVDPDHSSVSFVLRNLPFTRIRAEFRTFRGQLVTSAEITSCSAEFTIDVQSLRTGDADRDAALRSAIAPAGHGRGLISFHSAAVRRADHGFEVDGVLAINDVQRPLTLKGEVGGFVENALGGTRSGFSLSGRTSLTALGVDVDALRGLGGEIADAVEISVEIEAVLRREFSGTLSATYFDDRETVALGDVRFGIEGPIARITLNRPSKHNALNDTLLDGLEAALDRAEYDPAIRVVVLQGMGPSFSSGYDLEESDYSRESPGGNTLTNSLLKVRDMESRYQRLWNFPKPTIARIHGHALAGGCYLQLLCDVAVAAEDADLGHSGIKMGGVTSNPLWQVLLGVRASRYLLLTGRTISGREAERLNLVTLAVPGRELDNAVDSIAWDIASIPAESQLHHKETLNMALEVQGVGALFRYYGQMNAVARIGRAVSRAPDGSWLFGPAR